MNGYRQKALSVRPKATATDCRLPATAYRLKPTACRLGPAAAFSLIEVVAAVGIFAIGMVAVLALFAPVSKSVADVSDAESAARVADGVRARLQAMPFAEAAALLEEAATVRKNDADPAYNPNDGTKHPTVLFGKRNGEVAVYDAARKGWVDANYTGGTSVILADADKFFEIDLIRNDALSPQPNDQTASMVAYTMRVRWPAFVQLTATTAVQSSQAVGGVTADQSKKQMMFFTGAVTR